jgi:hypothetical protein
MKIAGSAFVLAALLAAPVVAGTCDGPLPAKGESISGQVSEIFDGGTFCVGRAEGGVKVRVAGFNACALNERGGEAGREVMRKIVFEKIVSCIVDERDGDAVRATCTVEGQPVVKVLRYAQTCERAPR